jgi:hypothetical protein
VHSSISAFLKFRVNLQLLFSHVYYTGNLQLIKHGKIRLGLRCSSFLTNGGKVEEICNFSFELHIQKMWFYWTDYVCFSADVLT